MGTWQEIFGLHVEAQTRASTKYPTRPCQIDCSTDFCDERTSADKTGWFQTFFPKKFRKVISDSASKSFLKHIQTSGLPACSEFYFWSCSLEKKFRSKNSELLEEYIRRSEKPRLIGSKLIESRGLQIDRGRESRRQRAIWNFWNMLARLESKSHSFLVGGSRGFNRANQKPVF